MAASEFTNPDYISRYQTAVSKLAKVSFLDPAFARERLSTHSDHSRLEALCHCFPTETTELGTKTRRYGYILSLEEALAESREKLLSKGYLAIASHLGGSVLIVGIKGPEAGWCHWFSIRGKGGKLPFYRYLTEDSWRPWEVLDTMRKNGGECGQDQFDDIGDSQVKRMLGRFLEMEAGIPLGPIQNHLKENPDRNGRPRLCENFHKLPCPGPPLGA